MAEIRKRFSFEKEKGKAYLEPKANKRMSREHTNKQQKPVTLKGYKIVIQRQEDVKIKSHSKFSDAQSMARPEADAALARAKDLCSTLCKIDGAAANGQFEAKRDETRRRPICRPPGEKMPAGAGALTSQSSRGRGRHASDTDCRRRAEHPRHLGSICCLCSKKVKIIAADVAEYKHQNKYDILVDAFSFPSPNLNNCQQRRGEDRRSETALSRRRAEQFNLSRQLRSLRIEDSPLAPPPPTASFAALFFEDKTR